MARCARILASLSVCVVLAGCATAPAGPTASSRPSAPASEAPVATASSPVAPSTAASRTPSPTGSAARASAAASTVAPKFPDEAPLKLLWQAGGPTTSRPRTMNPAIDGQGHIWVADSFDNRFWVFDRDGKFIEAWGAPGKGDGEFDFAKNGADSYGAIAFARDGSFYVADTGNHRIQRFDSKRRFVSAWGTFGSDDGQFAGGLAIGLDRDGNVYVDDDARQDIQMFKADGSYVRTFGGGRLLGWWFAFDAAGNLYYSDYIKRTLNRVAPDGTVTLTVDLSPYMSLITGIAVDDRGGILVASESSSGPDSDPERLIQLDSDGRLLHVWPTGGEQIAIDPKGDRLYVAFFTWPYIRAYELPAS